MWTHWKLAFVAAAASGFASLLPSLGLEPSYVVISLIAIVIQVFLSTWLGAWASKRSRLPPRVAVFLVVGLAVLVLILSVPIETHATVENLLDIDGPLRAQRTWLFRSYLLAAAALIVPAVASFAVCRAFGSPPNTALERTRER